MPSHNLCPNLLGDDPSSASTLHLQWAQESPALWESKSENRATIWSCCPAPGCGPEELKSVHSWIVAFGKLLLMCISDLLVLWFTRSMCHCVNILPKKWPGQESTEPACRVLLFASVLHGARWLISEQATCCFRDRGNLLSQGHESSLTGGRRTQHRASKAGRKWRCQERRENMQEASASIRRLNFFSFLYF